MQFLLTYKRPEFETLCMNSIWCEGNAYVF